jgi:undecaprenyl-diphosphatase
MTTLQAIVLAVLQGVTELFPVSSLGHAVLLPPVFGWTIDQHSPQFLPFLVVLHLGTAVALMAYFWRDWVDLLLAVLGQGDPERRAANLRLLLMLVVATVPAVVLGYLANKPLRALFAEPLFAGIFLVINGVLLLTGERLRRTAGELTLGDLGLIDALLIGGWQCAALFPGISRTGATIVGGLLCGLRHDEAARFSFLMATPIIIGASALEIPKMFHPVDGVTGGGLTSLALLAGVVAAITAYASVAFLMRYFKTHEVRALNPFGYYCLATGLAAIVWFGLS